MAAFRTDRTDRAHGAASYSIRRADTFGAEAAAAIGIGHARAIDCNAGIIQRALSAGATVSTATIAIKSAPSTFTETRAGSTSSTVADAIAAAIPVHQAGRAIRKATRLRSTYASAGAIATATIRVGATSRRICGTAITRAGGHHATGWSQKNGDNQTETQVESHTVH